MFYNTASEATLNFAPKIYIRIYKCNFGTKIQMFETLA